MESILIYLLKSAGLLSIFYLAYYFLLKNGTCFQQNRWFLFGGILAAFLLPSLEYTHTVLVENAQTAAGFPVEIATGSSLPQSVTPVDWWQISGIIYLVGLTVFLLKFFIQLLSLILVLRRSKKTQTGNFILVHSEKEIQPFSFFRYVVVNPRLHSPGELEIILKHEQAHVNQWHSLDVIVANLSNSILWFYPLSWLYYKSLVQNLEFLADREAFCHVESKKAYQKTLLKVSVADYQPALANHFYQSFIKKRIIMLNKKNTGKSTFWRAGLVLPVLLCFMFFFNFKTEARVVHNEQTSGATYKSDVEISVTISKHSQKEDLKKIEKLFKARGVDLKFSNLKYSGEGVLTNIAIQFKKAETDQSGYVSFSNPKGIGSTIFFSNDKAIGFRDVEKADGKKKASESILSELGENPLFIIGNKEYRAKTLVGKSIQVTDEVKVLAPKKASEIYGRKAKDGAVLLSEGVIVDDFKAALKEIDLKKNDVSRTYIQIEKDRKPVLVSVKTSITSTVSSDKAGLGFGAELIKNTPAINKIEESDFVQQYGSGDINAIQLDNDDTSRISFQENKPLVVVEGEIKEDGFQVNSISPENIESIKILKNESAVEQYGLKASNGAIIIDLKDGTISEEKKKTSISISKSNSSENLPDALYVVNDKIMPKDFDPESISPEEIEFVNVLKGEKAVQKYGRKAENAVIEIRTKK